MQKPYLSNGGDLKLKKMIMEKFYNDLITKALLSKTFPK